MSRYRYEHPVLGALDGVVVGNGTVVQFRAIKFASVPARYRQAVLLRKVESSRDFTSYGPVCPQLYDAPFKDGKGFGGSLPPLVNEFDEFECLNLTITIPKFVLDQPDSKKLPIMTWIHGGALKTGGGANYGLEDAGNLVALSIENGQPVIVIALQYRLGSFGFIASQEIVEESRVNNEPPGNFGLHDILRGFDWIHEFSAGFGGDTDNITAIGQSAGAIVISYLIIADGYKRPPFRRAILCSGTASLFGLHSIDEEQAAFDKLVNQSLPHGFGYHKLARLRQVSADKLLEVQIPIPLRRPIVDGVLFHQVFHLQDVIERTSRTEWLDAVIVGDCKEESALFTLAYDNVWSKFPNLVGWLKERYDSVIGQKPIDVWSKVLKHYGLRPGSSGPEAKAGTLQIMGAILFHAPAYAFARWKPAVAQARDVPIYLYHFDKRNPFPNYPGMSGKSHHFLDCVYLFQNVIDRAVAITSNDDEQSKNFERQVAKNFASKFIAFASAVEPWDRHKVGVIGDTIDGQWIVLDDREDEIVNKRDLDGWKLILS
ncbi:Alpha/Beta hydrolase protein [Lipomyces japonicus]|uniref:Alpha/Beta hydrolase protein n=1 Tax=Lipomyces japonicus TaxID=56871 RepID=UPI0034CF3638